MIFLKKNLIICNKNLYFINIKYNKNLNYIYCQSFFGLLKIKLFYLNIFCIYKLYYKINNLFYNLNVGWISILFLNGLGFKATRKVNKNNKKYWRFNIGHSHVFQYFSPENIILKSKNRYICVFSFKKQQLYSLTEKLKTFKSLNIYKGTGIYYPNQLIRLKVGKLKQ
jgi:ribosomal protein L6P/L9E